MKSPFVICGLLIVAGGLALAWQWRTGVQLEGEVGLLRAQTSEAARLRAENHRLDAGQVSAAELENLRADHAEVLRLRGEIEALKARENTAGATPVKLAPTSAPTETVATPPMIPAGSWKNAGRATPTATIETALWAAAGGNIAELADVLSWTGNKTEARIEAALAGLPEELRKQYGTPEQFLAFFAAKDIPLGSMQVLGPATGTSLDDGTNSAQMRVRYTAPDGNMKETTLLLFNMADASGSDWRVSIPAATVDRYIRMATDAAAQNK